MPESSAQLDPMALLESGAVLAPGEAIARDGSTGVPSSAFDDGVPELGDERLWPRDRDRPAAFVRRGQRVRVGGRRHARPRRRDPAGYGGETLDRFARRRAAQVLLRSLTVPGWGQATMGLKTSAWVFGLTELGIWTTFAAFRIQEAMRTDSYELTARLQAGINLSGRDEEFRRIVGSYISSDEYNQLVVYRDAANLYYNDPAAYNAYISAHELKGSDTWAWGDVDELLRYRGQRKDAQRASIRSNTCLAAAVVNRLLSAVHAARAQRAARKTQASLEPRSRARRGSDATAFRFGVRTRF